MNEPMGPREILGRAVGALWAAPVAAISALRHARMFHPRGVLYRAHVVPYSSLAGEAVARRFSGHALVRFSGATSKRDAEENEVLGIGMRISDREITSATPGDGDQDLLFATILSPLTMPLAPFFTRSDDFLENTYYAVAPFAIEDAGRVKIRLVPLAVTKDIAPSGSHARSRRSARSSSSRSDRRSACAGTPSPSS